MKNPVKAKQGGAQELPDEEGHLLHHDGQQNGEQDADDPDRDSARPGQLRIDRA
jgi:hypothetical protein